ncbi:MAG TPA: NAD-dependent epimerase/dehydratase family protein [Streptosporangiaceae bacterium]
MGETVLVTGGSGYVAGWCIAELLKREYIVRASLRSPGKEAAVRAVVAAARGTAAATGPGGQLSFAVADLTSDDGWEAAAAGCDYVLHVASPLGADGHASDLVGPAREGTLRVLRAAAEAGVKRVVLTSSTGACTPVGPAAAKVADETVWTDTDSPEVNMYRRSKTLAEQAAWEFIEQNPGPMTLTSVLPAAVFGPVLGEVLPGTAEVLQRLLAGQFRGIPRLGFCIVDARDLADLHLQAMTAPQAAGERFVAAGEFLWLAEIAQILRSRLGERGAQIPSRRMPSPILRALAWFVPTLRTLTPLLDRELAFSSAKAQRLLGFAPRPAADTLSDCATSLLERGPEGTRANLSP